MHGNMCDHWHVRDRGVMIGAKRRDMISKVKKIGRHIYFFIIIFWRFCVIFCQSFVLFVKVKGENTRRPSLCTNMGNESGSQNLP